MSNVIKATFSNSLALAREAQHAANPLMIRPALLRLMALSNWIYTVLTAVGTITIMLYFMGDIPNITYLFTILATGLIVIGLTAIGTYTERAAYADFVKTDFGASSAVEIDANGFTLIASQSHWMTGWRDVKDTFRTANTIGIVTPVIVIYVPVSALEDADTAFWQMTAWHKEASAT